MAKKIQIEQREDWLTQVASMMIDEVRIVHPVRDNLKLRFSMGDKGRKTKVIGHCYSSDACSDGYNQIFISPRVDDSMLVCAILLHEMIHAIDDNIDGHRGQFAEIARKMGFIGHKLTAINIDDLNESLDAKRLKTFKEYIKMFGPIPHGKLDDSKIKRDTNRNIKVWCPATSDCGFKFNTSRAQIASVIERMGEISCSGCGRSMRVTK